MAKLQYNYPSLLERRRTNTHTHTLAKREQASAIVVQYKEQNKSAACWHAGQRPSPVDIWHTALSGDRHEKEKFIWNMANGALLPGCDIANWHICSSFDLLLKRRIFGGWLGGTRGDNPQCGFFILSVLGPAAHSLFPYPKNIPTYQSLKIDLIYTLGILLEKLTQYLHGGRLTCCRKVPSFKPDTTIVLACGKLYIL